MQLLDLYVLVFRIVGILLAFYGVTWLSMFAGAASLEFLLGWALALVVYAATAFVLLRCPRAVARWLAGEDGEKTLTLGLGADDLQSVLLFAIGLYTIVVGIPSLVASLIPQPYYGSGILWQGVVRPAVQIIMGVLVLTRKRWVPKAARAW